MIAAWGLRDDLAERLSGQISGPAMASVARIPLLTALLCATAGGGGELPVHAAGIYERVLRRFLAQENRWPQLPEPEPTDIDRLIELLAPLAFHFAVRPDGWADRMPASQVMAVLRSLGPVFTELGRDAAAILRDLSVRAGVLVPSATQNAGHNPPYLFFHRSIAEYLAACHMATLPRQAWLEIVDEHLWFDSDWRATVTLLGAAFLQQERPGEAVFLIRHLLSQDPDPFNWALFRACRVISELPQHDFIPADLIELMTARMVRLLRCPAENSYTADFLGANITRLPWRVTEELMSQLETGSPSGVARILANSRDDRVTSRLISLLDDTAGRAEGVFDALASQDAECFVQPLLERFDNPRQRYRATMALAGYTAPAVTGRMLERVTDPHPRVRYYALHVLRERHGAGVTEAACDLSADPDHEVRLEAVAALAGRTDAAATRSRRYAEWLRSPCPAILARMSRRH